MFKLWCKQLQFNVTKHEYVPKHEKLNDDGMMNFKTDIIYIQSHNCHVFYILMYVRYYNFKPGDILKITGSSNSQNKTYEFYRCVK